MTVHAILSDPAYAGLKAYVLDYTGLEYYADKDEDFAVRLSRRMSALKIAGCAAYLRTLKSTGHGQERDALAGELTIGETYFFRQNEHFELLRTTIVPDLLRRNRDRRTLRIWSAGCAIGAEPYSVALLLHSEFSLVLEDWNVYILGTDINVEFLAQARTGNFSEWTLRDVSPEVKAWGFRNEEKRWILNKEIREAVTFRYHNLADDSSPPSPDEIPFDLILCRNVMIYFSLDRTRAVVSQLFHRLNEGGWLLVGYAECGGEQFPQFVAFRDANVTAYRKLAEGADVSGDSAPLWQPWDDGDPAPDSTWQVEAHAPDSPRAEDPPLEADSLEHARALADQGLWSEAETRCRGLLKADPLDAPAHLILGLILTHTGTAKSAMTELRRAIYSNRQFALAHYHLGTLLQKAGNTPEARKAFRNVSRLLNGRPGDEILDYGDGITAGELAELTRMHQEILSDR